MGKHTIDNNLSKRHFSAECLYLSSASDKAYQILQNSASNYLPWPWNLQMHSYRIQSHYALKYLPFIFCFRVWRMLYCCTVWTNDRIPQQGQSNESKISYAKVISSQFSPQSTYCQISNQIIFNVKLRLKWHVRRPFDCTTYAVSAVCNPFYPSTMQLNFSTVCKFHHVKRYATCVFARWMTVTSTVIHFFHSFNLPCIFKRKHARRHIIFKFCMNFLAVVASIFIV